MLFKDIKNYFLSEFTDDSFILQQKASVLLWVQLILIPVIASYLVINIIRGHPQQLIGVIVIDCVLIVTFLTGIILLRKGKYHEAVNLNVIVITIITIAGHIVKRALQIETGINSFSPILYAALVFTAMFGTRQVLLTIAVLFFSLTAGMHIYSVNYIDGATNITLVSGSLNILVALLAVACLSILNGNITDTALKRVQKELDINREFNLTLESKVAERTAALKESIENIKILEGMLPICSLCKKIRDDSGYWNQLETYIRDNSEAEFSHSLCPVCAEKLYPQSP